MSDIFESGAECLVNPVNCVGVMGAGLARHFRIRYPDYFIEYHAQCKVGRIRLGQISLWTSPQVSLWTNPRIICSFPTKGHWIDDADIEAIKAGLEHLVELVNSLDIRSIAIPALGCGLGGLDWKDVRPLIVEAADKMTNCDVTIYGPQ